MLTPHGREATLMTALDRQSLQFFLLFFLKRKSKKKKKRIKKIKCVFLPARSSTNSVTGMLPLQVSLLIILEAGRQKKKKKKAKKKQGG